MQGMEYKKINHVLPNGKCSNCRATIRSTDPDGMTYKTRLVKTDMRNKTSKIKCPQCREMISVD